MTQHTYEKQLLARIAELEAQLKMQSAYELAIAELERENTNLIAALMSLTLENQRLLDALIPLPADCKVIHKETYNVYPTAKPTLNDWLEAYDAARTKALEES